MACHSGVYLGRSQRTKDQHPRSPCVLTPHLLLYRRIYRYDLPSPCMSNGVHPEMPNASRITPSIPLSTHDDLEALSPSPQKEPSRSVLSRLASVVRRFPLLSATFLYASLVGGIAGLAKWSYNRDGQPALKQITQDQDGVRLASVLPAQLVLTQHTVDRAHRAQLSGGYSRPNIVD